MKVVAVFAWLNSGLGVLMGLDWGAPRLYTLLSISFKAFWEDVVVLDDLRERGVKNRLNFLGVIEGFRLSFFVDFPSSGACVDEVWSNGGNSWDDGGVVWRESSPEDIVLVCRGACGV